MIKRQNNNSGLLLLSFIFSPLLAAIMILIQVHSRKKCSLFLLALFMGFISTYYFPIGDQFRWLNDLIYYRKASFSNAFDFSDIYIFRDFNLVSFFVYLSAKIGFSLEIIRCIIVTICYVLMFDIFKRINNSGLFENHSSSYRFISFLLLFFAVPYFLVCYGFRTGIGAALFMYGFYLLVYEKRKESVIYLLLSVSCHIFYILWIFFLLMAYIIPKKIGRGLFIISLILILLASTTILFDYFYEKNELLDALMDDYVYRSRDNVDRHDLIISIIAYWGLSVITFFFIFIRNSKARVADNFIYIVFLSIALFFPFQVLLQRSLAAFVPIIVVYFTIYRDTINAKYLAAKLLLICLMFGFFTPFWRQRDMYSVSGLSNVLIYPAPVYLFHTYESEALRMVDSEGTLKTN